jgi:cell wall-associated NlpC family hydrolase
MKHWAAGLVGKPYRAGCAGPDEFDCVGLVRYYFRARHGLELPDYHLDVGASLAEFVRATRWRRTQGRPQEDDVLLLTGPAGRHVGVMVANSEGLGLLHAVGTSGFGHVVWQPLPTLVGYTNPELWRQHAD